MAYEKPQWEMHYFQSVSGNEIDLVLDKSLGNPILIEIKSTDGLGKLELDSTLNLMEEFKSKHCFVLSQDPIAKKLSNSAHGLHWEEGIKTVLSL